MLEPTSLFPGQLLLTKLYFPTPAHTLQAHINRERKRKLFDIIDEIGRSRHARPAALRRNNVSSGKRQKTKELSLSDKAGAVANRHGNSYLPLRFGGEAELNPLDGHPIYPGLSGKLSDEAGILSSAPLPLYGAEILEQDRLVRQYRQLVAIQSIKKSFLRGFCDREVGFNKRKGARDEEVEDASESSLSGESDGDAEDVLCQVCMNGESSDHDQILYCDRCNIAVHQSCYGVQEVPEGDFFCELCASLNEITGSGKSKRQRERYASIYCSLCGMRGGALKQAVPEIVDAYESEADMTGDSDSDVDADESKSAHGKRPRNAQDLLLILTRPSSSDAEGSFKESEKSGFRCSARCSS